jgi:hypothetical protein
MLWSTVLTSAAVLGWLGLRRRISAMERDVWLLKTRLPELETMTDRIAADTERMQVGAVVAPVEAAAEARRIEAEVKAQAAVLEATTAHYPRL